MNSSYKFCFSLYAKKEEKEYIKNVCVFSQVYSQIIKSHIKKINKIHDIKIARHKYILSFFLFM